MGEPASLAARSIKAGSSWIQRPLLQVLPYRAIIMLISAQPRPPFPAPLCCPQRRRGGARGAAPPCVRRLQGKTGGPRAAQLCSPPPSPGCCADQEPAVLITADWNAARSILSKSVPSALTLCCRLPSLQFALRGFGLSAYEALRKHNVRVRLGPPLQGRGACPVVAFASSAGACATKGHIPVKRPACCSQPGHPRACPELAAYKHRSALKKLPIAGLPLSSGG